MYKIIFIFLLYQAVSIQAKCLVSNKTEDFLKVNYTFHPQNEVNFRSLEISGFANLKDFFENCILETNDVVEFSLQYKFKKEFGSKLWKQLGEPFDVWNSNIIGSHPDIKQINVEHNQR